MRTAAVALLTLLAMACGSTASVPGPRAEPGVEDALTAIPQNYRLLFQNEYVRAIEHRLPAGASEPTHSHPYPRVIYAVQPSRIRVRDGGIREVESKPSDVVFREAQVHAIENIGAYEAVFIMVELKQRPEGEFLLEEDDAITVAPEVYRLLFENDRVRVIEVRSIPGVRTPMHSHPGRAFRYRMVTTNSRIILPDGTVVESENPAGAAVWSPDPSRHILENIGTTGSRTLLVELK